MRLITKLILVNTMYIYEGEGMQGMQEERDPAEGRERGQLIHVFVKLNVVIFQ